MAFRSRRLRSLTDVFIACLVAGALLQFSSLAPFQPDQLSENTRRQPRLVSPGMNLRDPTAKIFAMHHDSYEPRLSHRGGWAVAERCRQTLDVLVFVHSSAHDWRRRAALRDTLFEEAAARRFNWTGVFFSGRRSNDSDLDAWLDLEADFTGDLVVFPVQDGPFNITPKLLAGMRWVADHCPTIKKVIKIDDDVMVEPFLVLLYYREMVAKWPRYLHCYVYHDGKVYRDPKSRYFVSEEEFPDDTYMEYCSGRAVIMTYAVMRQLLRATSHISTHPSDDAYVFGDLALAVGIGHVDITPWVEWNVEYTHCIYLKLCLFTHEYSAYGADSLRRGQWGLLLEYNRLLTGNRVDLSTRLELPGYKAMFDETRREISRPAAVGNITVGNIHATMRR